MTLLDLSAGYQDSAFRVRLRIAELQAALPYQPDQNAQQHLKGRIAALKPLAREMQTLAVLTGRYYDRSYHKNERYTL